MIAWLTANAVWLIPLLSAAAPVVINALHARGGNAGLGILSSVLNSLNGTRTGTPATPGTATSASPGATSTGILASLASLAESELSDPAFITTVQGLLGQLPVNNPVTPAIAAAASNPDPTAAATVIRHLLGARRAARQTTAGS